MRLTLDVILTNSEYVKKLENELESSRSLCEALQKKVNALEFKCAGEQKVNLELIDLCREHGISVRKTVDMRSW